MKIKRDRYVARVAGDAPGVLRTVAFTSNGDELSLNVDASKGAVQAQVVDENGNVLKGYSYADCAAITADALDAPLQWKGKSAALKGKTVRLEFALRNARLFALNIGD